MRGHRVRYPRLCRHSRPYQVRIWPPCRGAMKQLVDCGTTGYGNTPTFCQPMKEPKPVCRLLREWKRIKQENGVLCRVVQKNGQEVRQLILPGSLKDKVPRSVHDDLGHQAVEKTTALTRDRC